MDNGHVAIIDGNPLIDYHLVLAKDFTERDALVVFVEFAKALNKIAGSGLTSGKFTAVNPVIQHAMQAAASLEVAAGNLHQQLNQASNIVDPFAQTQPGPRRIV